MKHATHLALIALTTGLFACASTDEPAIDCLDTSSVMFQPPLEEDGTYEITVVPQGEEGVTCTVSHAQGEVVSEATCTNTVTRLLNLESSSTRTSMTQREVARILGVSWYRLSTGARVTVRHDETVLLDADVALSVTSGPTCDESEATVSVPSR